jgi:hypothetical protein
MTFWHTSAFAATSDSKSLISSDSSGAEGCANRPILCDVLSQGKRSLIVVGGIDPVTGKL